MNLKGQTILIVSNEPWGDIWYSKHNWAYELSKKNKVFFINPPQRWNFKNLFFFKISTLKYTDNLTILYYDNILPLSRFELIYKINNYLVSKLIKKWFEKNNLQKFIFWTFDPIRLTNPNLFRPLISIYFIADKYQTKREKELIKNTDYFIAISKDLTKDLPVKNPLILSHGIAESEFKPDEEINQEEGYVLYVGNIDYRLDYDLIKKMATSFPKEQFLFIGKKHLNTHSKLFMDIFIENKYPNIFYHPPVHFKKLKNYIAKAKVCISPMLMEVKGNNINHHKLLQYLALGKPVISPLFTDYENSNILYTYTNHDEAIKLLEKVLNNKDGSSIIEKRINFAKQYTYDKLIKKVEKFISFDKTQYPCT